MGKGELSKEDIVIMDDYYKFLIEEDIKRNEEQNEIINNIIKKYGKKYIKRIKIEMEDSNWDIEGIVEVAKGEKQESIGNYVYCCQNTGGGYTGDDWYGTMYFPLDCGGFIEVSYHC